MFEPVKKSNEANKKQGNSSNVKRSAPNKKENANKKIFKSSFDSRLYSKLDSAADMALRFIGMNKKKLVDSFNAERAEHNKVNKERALNRLNIKKKGKIVN